MILFVFIFYQFTSSSKSTTGVFVGCKSTNFSGNKKEAQEAGYGMGCSTESDQHITYWRQTK